jgi:8-oxo-dGTP diphosphatase
MPKINTYLATNPPLTRAVVGFLITRDNHVILGLRKKVSFGLGANLISGIGGKVGDIEGLENETDEEAMQRETKEEIGVRVTNLQKVAEITFLFPDKPKWNQFVIGFIIDKWTGELEETDVIKPKIYNVDQLPTNSMWEDNKYWLPLVFERKHVKATFLYGSNCSSVVEKVVKQTSY